MCARTAYLCTNIYNSNEIRLVWMFYFLNSNISMICILGFITLNNINLLCSNAYSNQFMSAFSVINSFSCGSSFSAYWWLIVLSNLDFTIYYENEQHQQHNSFITKAFYSASFLFSTQEHLYFVYLFVIFYNAYFIIK